MSDADLRAALTSLHGVPSVEPSGGHEHVGEYGVSQDRIPPIETIFCPCGAHSTDGGPWIMDAPQVDEVPEPAEPKYERVTIATAPHYHYWIPVGVTDLPVGHQEYPLTPEGQFPLIPTTKWDIPTDGMLTLEGGGTALVRGVVYACGCGEWRLRALLYSEIDETHIVRALSDLPRDEADAFVRRNPDYAGEDIVG
jgi:hypothetical protein